MPARLKITETEKRLRVELRNELWRRDHGMGFSEARVAFLREALAAAKLDRSEPDRRFTREGGK